MYFEMYKDASGQWRWRLKSANHQIVAVSGEGYTSKASCENGIAAVKKCGTAPVKDA